MFLYSERDEIQINPDYQRAGEIWNLEKRQLLIDSILNDYDLPKIYFHDLRNFKEASDKYEYSIIDGRQRLETIWKFMNDDFTTANDFVYQRNPELDLAGLSYSDLAKDHAKIRIRFDSFVLPIVLVETSEGDIDLIEDMFSRLNEAVPLNAAEKRNAIGGRLVQAITSISKHDFFNKKVKFSNKRYQHREISARILLIEKCLQTRKRLLDTKKFYLDELAKSHKKNHKALTEKIESEAKTVLDSMARTFSNRDVLLSAQGNMVVYYLLFREGINKDKVDLIKRRKLLDFGSKLKENRETAIHDIGRATFELLEYDRLTQQGTNDAGNIKQRYKILADFIGLDGDIFDYSVS